MRSTKKPNLILRAVRSFPTVEFARKDIKNKDYGEASYWIGMTALLGIMLAIIFGFLGHAIYSVLADYSLNEILAWLGIIIFSIGILIALGYVIFFKDIDED